MYCGGRIVVDLKVHTGGGDGEGEPVFPDRYANGKPRGTYRNARIAATCFGARFSFDEFSRRFIVNWHMLDGFDGHLTDAVVDRFRGAIMARFEFDAKKENTADAISSLCWENAFDPVRDYLAALKWDGHARISDWLRVYLGAEDSAYARAVGRKTLIAAVRRTRRPGCKFDNVLVLEGGQGTGKSSALRILAIDDDRFTDQDLIHLDIKIQKELLAGKWIVELAELAGMRRAENERVKAFVSRTHDRARAAYAHFSDDQPRRCVFIGTTNADEYLSDPTGNRRFWCVRTGEIDLERLRLDVGQLWAEAASAEAAGESLLLDKDLWQHAADQADRRMQSDPWEDILRKVKGDVAPGLRGLEERIFSSDLMGRDDILNVPKERQNLASAQRLKACMKKLGWDGPDRIRIGGAQARGYWRAKKGTEQDEHEF